MASFSPEEIAEWKQRSDVLYHFYAYSHFAKKFPSSLIDLVNLDDADVQYYNRISDTTRGLGAQHKLAEYLVNQVAKESVHANNHRKRFVSHVARYNSSAGRVHRRRFFMIGVGDYEQQFLNATNDPAGSVETGYAKDPLPREMLWATDGVVTSANKPRGDLDRQEADIEADVNKLITKTQLTQTGKVSPPEFPIFNLGHSRRESQN